MTEPDVALTDYLLTLECLILSVLILRRKPLSAFGYWLLIFFGAIGLAAFSGGTFHGFFNRPSSLWHGGLWLLTMLAIGVAALAAWHLGSLLIEAPRAKRWISFLAMLWLMIYVAVLLSGHVAFIVAIIYYLPAILFLLAAFVLHSYRYHQNGAKIAAIGTLLTLVASWVQIAGIGLHPRYFTPSALQHVIQTLSLLLIYQGSLSLNGPIRTFFQGK